MQLYTKILIGMAVGVVLGIAVGPNSFLLPRDGVRLAGDVEVLSAPDGGRPMPLAAGVERMRLLDELPGDPAWIQVGWTLRGADLLRLQNDGVEEAAGVHPGTELTGWVRDTPRVQRYAPVGQVLVDSTAWIGRLFLALIEMVVVPLVFFSLLVGVASLGDVRRLGRLGVRTLVFFLCTTAVALVIGVGLCNLVRPGHLLDDADR